MGFNKEFKKVKRKSNKIVKKIGKSAEKSLKQAIVPIVITIATGGAGAAIATTIVSTHATRKVTKEIKNPVLSAAVGAVISGSISGSTTIIKDATKAAITTKVAQKTKSSALGAVLGSTLVGDYTNVRDITKNITKEVVKEQVSKKILKKTNNDIISQLTGSFVGLGIENTFDNIVNKGNILEEDKHTLSLYTETNEDSTYFDEDEYTSNLDIEINRDYNSHNLINEGVALNLDTGQPDFDIGTSFTNDQTTTSVSTNLNSISLSNMTPIDDNLNIGNSLSLNQDGIKVGIKSQQGVVTTERGVSYDKILGWDSELYTYQSVKVEEKTDITGICITKETVRKDLNIPTCGKVGSYRQEVTICSDSITTTDRIGVNGNGALSGATIVIPIAKGTSVVSKIGGKQILINIEKFGKDTIGKVILDKSFTKNLIPIH